MTGLPPEVLIVGQGLAGTVMHYTLLQRGVRAIVADLPWKGSSTKAAAGIVNPITGPNYVLSWNFRKLLEVMLPFYRSVEELLGVKLLYSMPLYRHLPSLKDINNWIYRSDHPGMERFYGEMVRGVACYPEEKQHEMYGKVENAYRCDLRTLLSTYRDWLQAHQLLAESSFDFSAMKLTTSGLEWRGMQFHYVIFCEGSKVVNNPYFAYLPVIGAKGEALIIPETLGKSMMTKRKGMLTTFDSLHNWYGATLVNHYETTEPTMDGRKELEEKFVNDFGRAPQVIQQLAGIRPTVPDRRPLAGTHPHHERLMIMNGLGTKGTSMAPWLASVLANHLLMGEALPGEVDIARYRDRLSRNMDNV